MTHDRELPPRLHRIIEHNAEYEIIEAAWLDKDGKEPRGAPETWVKHRLTYSDGTVFTVTDEEQQAMLDAGFEPRWRGIGYDPR